MRNCSFCFVKFKTLNRLCRNALFFVSIFLPVILVAQSHPEKGLPFVTNFSPKTFGSYPQTWAVAQDDKGLMYFGNQGYILQYDGVKWQKINCARSGTVAIRSLAKNKNGIIYYAAIGDFGYLSPDSLGQIKAHSLLDYVPDSLRNFNDIWSVYPTNEGVYFQARERIFMLKTNSEGKPTGEIRSWNPKTKFMYAFYLDDVYYVHQQGLGLFKMINNSLELIAGSEFLGKERMQVMLPYFEDDKREYLIGMFYGGLYIYDGKNFRRFSVEADSLLKATLYKAALLKDGSYALATAGKGLVIMDKEGKTLQVINRAAGLQDESVYSVYPDNEGNVWMGLDNGISKIETASPLTQFTIQSGITTAALCVDRFEGSLYLGTTNGLLRLNDNTNHFEPIKDIYTNQVFAFWEDNGEMIVATDGLYSVKDKKTRIIHRSISGNMQLAALYIPKKYPNVLFTGESIQGLAVFTRKNSTSQWQFTGYFPGINQQGWTFAEDSSGIIWEGTQNEFVYEIMPKFDEKGNLDLAKSTVQKFGKENGLGSGCGPVYTVNGKVYFASDSALYRFDKKTKRFFADTTFGSFPSAGGKDEAYIKEDYSGRVWLRLGKESEIAIPQPDGSYKINKTALLPIADRTISQFYPEKNGIVWICTTDGLVRYDEKLKKNYDQTFKTLIRNITAGNQILNPDIDENNPDINIASSNNSLRFEYAAPFFEQEEKTQYQTWLEGFDKEWSNWGNNYYKEYTNLSAGNYKFHVRAKNVYQKIGDEAVYTFTVNPPWYQTWWAYLLYALIAIGIVYLIIRYRTAQLHLKHRELEKTVSERTVELQQRVQELAVINSVQESLVAQMDIQAIYDLIGDKIQSFFDAQAVIIATLSQDTKTEQFNYTIEKGERFYLKPRKYDKLRQHLVETGQKILINNNYEEAAKKFGLTVLPGTENPKSLLFVPLSIGDKVKSYISLQNIDKENAFSEADVKLLETLANSMSVALENARLFDETTRLLKETEQRNAELGVINSVQESLVAQMDMDAIYDLVGEKMREIFNAQVIDIVTYDKTTNLIEDRYSYEKGDRTLVAPREPSGFRKHVIETKQLLWHNDNVEQAMHQFNNAIIIGEMPKSQVYAPMIAGGEVTGIVSLQNLDQEHAFTESNVSLLTTLVNSMSVALESARLFNETNRLLKETEQRTAELAVINSVQEGLAHELDMQGIYDLVGDRVQRLFNAQVVIIASFDLPNKKEYFNYAFENGEKYNIESRTISEMRQMLIDTKHTIYIETEEKASTVFGITAIGDTKMPKSLLFVPLLSGSEIKGYVSLQNVDTENAFSQSDIRLLETLSNSMTVALENVRLFDETSRLLKETEQRTAELALINSVQEGLVREMDIQSIYDLVGDRVQKLFQAQTVVIASFNFADQTEQFNYAFENNKRYNFEPRPINKLRQLIIEKKQTIYIETEEKARNEYGIKPIEDSEMPKSLLFVPLLSGKEIKGYVSLQNIDIEHAFNQSDISLLETLINSMSVALENARLFDETKILLAETEKGKKNVELLSDIGKEITASLDFETIFYKLYDHINQLADATIFGVGIYQPEQHQIEYKFAVEKGKRYAPYSRSTTDKNQFPVWCIENRQPVFINNVKNEYSRYIPHYKEKPLLLEDGSYAKDAESIIYLPLIVQERLFGIITIQSFQKNAYTEYHLNLLQNLATYTSIALDNANAYRKLNEREQEIGQRVAELSAVNSISRALASQLDVSELINFVGEEVHQLFRANISYVALLDKKTKTINFLYENGEKMPPRKLGEGFTSKIILSGKPLLINKEITLKSQELGVQRIGVPAASYLGVPIPVGDEIIGVLSVQSTEQENRFSEKDMRLLTTIAAHVGVALRKAKLFEEVKQANLEADSARKAAEQANAAKSAFLSTVSHELRTPLTSVLGFAKIIKKRLEEKVFPATNTNDAKMSKTLQQISDNLNVVIAEGERLTNLINDVLDLAKIEAGKMEWNMEPLVFPEVLDRAVAATSSLFMQKNLKLEKEVQEMLPMVSGDKDKLIQVMVNLLSNAVKFTNEGSVVCSVSKKKDEIIVAVTDTGIGIAPDDHAAVFEQFKQVGDTLTDKPKGTGLGLPICKEIIEHHGGRIWLESELGNGSTFFFALPLIPERSATIKPIHFDDLVRQLKQQVAQSRLNLKGSNPSVLIVDDDASIRSLLRQELSEAGYLIEEAENGQEALEHVREKHPDLIILDVMMPEMNGFDVAAILKNDPQTMDIPIIILSVVQDKSRGYRIGVDRYLTKPINTQELFSEVGSLLEQGKSHKKVMVVDEDTTTVHTLADVLHAQGYQVVESDGKELVEKAISSQPDIIILNSVLSGKQEIVQTLRFEKGLENVVFLVYQ